MLALSNNSPEYNRNWKITNKISTLPTFNSSTVNPMEALKILLASPNHCSKKVIWEQFDHMVLSNTILPPGANAGIVKIDYDNEKTLREFIQDSRDIEKKGMKTEDWAKFELINSSKVSLLDPLYYLSDGIQKETPVGLSHIIIDKQENTPNYIQDVFFNEKKYPYLIKKFDSEDFGLKYEVKIFEIDYKKFDEIFN